MKKFKNNFEVKGSPRLLMALKEEVEKLGWKYDNDFNPWGRHPDLYFNANSESGSMKTQHFSSSSVCNCTIYTLPQQWDECLKAASELEEEIPEYIECIKAYSLQTEYIIEGYIYKVLDSTNLTSIELQCNRIVKDRTSKTPFICFAGVKEFDFIPSTKEAYEKQQEKVKIQELLEEAKRRYPVGTKFRCLVTNDIETIPTNVTFKIDNKGTENNMYSYVNGCLFHKHYYNGKWAEIIEPKKEVEPWAIGTYVVFLKEYGGNPKGTISSIVRTRGRTIDTEATLFQTDKTCCLFKDKECEWFPTLQEAEAFSRGLLNNRNLLKVEPMEIAGYSVKFKDDKVSIGCYKDITLKDLKTMRKAIKVASKFGKDLTVTEDSIIDNTEDRAIFLDEIEQLIERLDG